MKKSLVKNFAYKLCLNFFKIMLPLLYIPYIYRLFNSSTMGNIEFSQSIVNYFAIFAGFGVYTFGLREISRGRDDEKEKIKLFSELFMISLISTLLVLVSYLTYIYISDPQDQLKTLLLINSTLICSYLFYIEWINEALENYEFITKKNIIVRTLSVVFIFIFVKDSKDFYKYLLIFNLTHFINNLWSYIYIKKHIKLDFKNLELKKYIFPLGIILLINNVNVLYTQLDKLALGFYSDIKMVAYYGIGQKVMIIVFMIVMSLVSVSIPRLSYYIGKDRSEYISLFNKLMNYMSFLIFPISIGIILLSKEISIFFGGVEYIVASTTVAVFGIRMVGLAFESMLSNQVLFLHKKEKVIAFIFLICGGINFIFKYILIKGYFGMKFTSYTAILTTMIAEVMIIILDYLYIKRYLKLNILVFTKDNFKYLLISLVFIPIIMGIKLLKYNYLLTSFLSVFSCVTLYILMLITVKDRCLYEVFNKICPKKFRK